MNREEIIRMAREAGILMRSHEYQSEPTKLERFAALVADYVCKREHKWMSEVLGVLPISNENLALMRETIQARGNQ